MLRIRQHSLQGHNPLIYNGYDDEMHIPVSIDSATGGRM